MNQELKEAIELSIEVWKELTVSGKDKDDSLSQETENKIIGMLNKCPLCELFRKNKYGNATSYMDGCPECPLKSCTSDSLFNNWHYGLGDTENSKLYAQKIVDKLEEALK
jgi:hypothetical protein